jgi:PAS domain S-box-containing protein
VIKRKRAEEKLRFQARLLDVIGQAVIATNVQGNIIYWNRAAERLYGWSEEEVMGRPIVEVTPSEDLVNRAEEIMANLMAGKSWSGELEVRRKDGTTFPAMVTDTPAYDEQGTLAAIIGVSTDISELKNTEELRRSEASLAEAQRIAHLGTWEWNLMTGEVRWSDETYRIFGFEPQQFSPTLEKVEKIFHQDDRHLFRALVDDATRKDEAYDFEHRIVRPDGEVRWVNRRGEVVRGEEGESLRLIGTVHDITERKRVERELIEGARQAALGEDVGAALNESGNLWIILQRCAAAIVRHLDAAFTRIWTLNEEENVLELQASAGVYTHLRGAHSRVPVGKFKIGLIAQERLPYLTNDIAGDPRIHDKEWARREGMVAFAGYPLLVEDRLVGVLAMFAKERLAEATLNALASVANTIAQGIERKRAEESLRAYAARLNRSNRELQDFAYVASHDLQEPLRKVRTFADRLDTKYGEVLGEQGRDYLKRMEGAAARMQGLIDDLLELSRVTTNAQPFTPVDLNEVAQEVVIDLEARIEQIGGRVEVSRLPIVEADRLQMRQLLQNLISNALKFHRQEEEPIVKVYSELLQEWKEEGSERIADHRAYQIFVEDNGIGFDEKHLELVLAPFQRLHGRDAYEGTGMGMAICRKVVERHNGYITAKSTPGQGATFIVTLPIRQSEGNMKRE